jgi:pilus assembly protein FimV
LKDHSLSAGRFALNRVAVAAACAVLGALPAASWALGLGKLNVQSSLGESLRAEIDITNLTPEEGASLQVKVASPETYRAAGVDYNQVLAATAIALQRRADGRPYLKISSDRSVQEPFVDVILDLAWSSGRLVREYTLLFDPPASRTQAQATSPVIDAPAPSPAPSRSAQVEAPVRAPATRAPVESVRPRGKPVVPQATAPVASAPETAAQAPAPKPAPAPKVAQPSVAASGAADVATVRVKRGDSLSAIASRTQQPGVSLDQMLVGLYRQNPDAFVGNNMNRLKSGVVLNVPDADAAKAVTQDEARKVIQAQSADFAAYRQHLAGAVAPTTADAPQRQVKGKVEAEVKDQKQAAAPTPDKLTLSKGGMGAASAPAAEDRLAKSRAKEESATRVAELSKNLDELRKLKDKTAAASAPAKAAPPGPAPVPAPAPAPAPVAPSKPVVVASAPAPAVEASRPAPVEPVASAASMAEPVASAPVESASGSAISAADSASLPASVPSSSLPSLQIQTPPVEQQPASTGFLESLNPMLLAAGGAGVALLAGVAMFLRSRRRSDSGETSFLESRLQPDSFFGASGGQRVDTRDASGGPSSMSYSLSQLDAIGDVDPVAEADVYLAYGRDLQAEEILKEALRSTPDRLAVRTKLLEVYAKRRDTKGYEQLATQLYALTNGQGEDWAKAQEMGLGIDAENPLYQAGGQPSAAPLSVEAASDMLGASTIPHSVMPAPSLLDTVAPPLPPEPQPEPGDVDFVDLDLDISAPAPLDSVNDSVSPGVTEDGDLPPLTLPFVGESTQFNAPTNTVTEPAKAPADELADLPSLEAIEPAKDDVGLDFDLSPAAPFAPPPAPPAFDMDSISLDLDSPAPAAPAGTAALPELVPTEEAEEDWLNSAHDEAVANDPMARKFELAEEFRQIGDLDGARELLGEVLDNASDGPLRAKAQAMLDSLN